MLPLSKKITKSTKRFTLYLSFIFQSVMSKSFSVIMQYDSMQCGVVCLAMICKHFGKKISIEYISGQCFPTTEGVSLFAIDKVALKLGLKTISA